MTRMSTGPADDEWQALGTPGRGSTHDARMSEPAADVTIHDLQHQIDLLRAEVDRLRGATHGLPDGTLPRAPATDVAPASTRRGVLKLAGATAAGALASAAVAGRAAADVGYTTGGSISVGDVVRQQLNGSRSTEAGFLFATTSAPALTSNASEFGCALAGWAIDGTTRHGVVGRSTAAGGLGVVGEATAAGGTGVRGVGQGTDGVGVYGNGGHYGVQGYTEASNGIGGSFAGYAGAIQLVSWFIGSPPTRANAHEPGVLEADVQGDLWFCYKGGTPGDWRRVTGRGTAGAFTVVAPGRVYDSRVAAPSPGTLTGGQHRTISVADRRDPTTGAVALADFVPTGATAIAANVTIVSTDGAGFLVCNPGGTTTVDASTINWSAAGQVLANGVILALDDQRRLTIVAGGGGTTHVLVDVTGYWR